VLNGFASNFRLLMTVGVSVTNPTPDAAADMGIRDWPQQLKKGSWQETSADGQTLIRYILDGTGVLEVETSEASKSTTKLSPGTLVEISCGSTLSWKADNELIILTPSFEEGGLFIGALAVMLVTFVALIASSGS
jgi:hypothetical protein